MKAVVLEIKDGYAAVLSEDGQFRKIEDEGYTPGMELTLETKKEKRDFGKVINFRSKRLWQGAATIAAALLIFIGVKDFNTPYSTVSLDVNPSIEISINRYDMVLDIEALNDDADEIVDELNAAGLKYKSVDDAVDMALSSFSEGDYAAEDGTTYVMISANSESDKHSDKIANELDSLCSKHEDIAAKTIAADDELVERAKEFGTTAGKLYLVDSLKDSSGEEDFDESEWLKKPVKDIIQEIDKHKDDVPQQDAPNDSEPNPNETPGEPPASDPSGSDQPVPPDMNEPGAALPQGNQDQPEPKDPQTEGNETQPGPGGPGPQDPKLETGEASDQGPIPGSEDFSLKDPN